MKADSATSWLLLAGMAWLTIGAPCRAAPAGEAARFETAVIIPSDGGRFCSNSYPTVATLPDGRLFLTWMVWTATKGECSRIVGAFSADGGRSWSTPETVLDTPVEDYDPSIVVTPEEIQVYSTSTPRKQKLIDRSEMWRAAQKLSGGPWSAPERMPPHHAYETGKVHVGLTLQDGTLLMPYSWDVLAEAGTPADREGGMKLRSGVLRSRDGGRTWSPGGDIVGDAPKKTDYGTAGVCEPAIVVLPDGELFALLRTCDDWHYQSRSRDGGLTWDPAGPSPLTGHNTPSALWLLRDHGEVLVAWNNSPRQRWPLDVAYSADGCRTWSAPRTLADTPGIESSYPTATQLPDGMIVVIWQQALENPDGRELRIARFNRAWLRGGTPP